MNFTLSRRQALLLAGAALAAPLQAQTSAWQAIEKKARGQTVYFNAWAGSQNINAYLQWAGAEVQKRFGVTLSHVKITDTAEVVKRVRIEKAAGKVSEGSVDLVWINGENFLSMKREKLLFGPFAESLPNFAFVDVLGKPTTRLDFSEPVDGLEAPLGHGSAHLLCRCQARAQAAAKHGRATGIRQSAPWAHDLPARAGLHGRHLPQASAV